MKPLGIQYSHSIHQSFRFMAFRKHRDSRVVSRLLGFLLSELLPAALLRLFARDHSLETLGEGQDDQGDEVLDHLDNPSCWCPEFVFGVIDCASIAHEAGGSRLAGLV